MAEASPLLPKMKAKYSRYALCHVALVTSCGAGVCTVVIGGWSRSMQFPPTQSRIDSAVNHDYLK